MPENKDRIKGVSLRRVGKVLLGVRENLLLFVVDCRMDEE